MQLSDIRSEVMNNGFGTTRFPASRVNNYINKGYQLICRKVDYYIDEATQTYATTSGQTNISLPANWARTRSLLDTDFPREVESVGLRDIDGAPVTSGTPRFYAEDGVTLRLWPTCDGIYNLELRYWIIPALLVNDTDVPSLPSDWHDLLWMYATARCFKADDDAATAESWMQEFNAELSTFEADQRFPDANAPTQIKSMWGDDARLGVDGWHRFLEGF